MFISIYLSTFLFIQLRCRLSYSSCRRTPDRFRTYNGISATHCSPSPSALTYPKKHITAGSVVVNPMVVAVTRRSSEDVKISPFLCKDPQILGGDKQH